MKHRTKPILRKTPIKRSLKSLRKTRLKRVSSKRAKDMKIYSAKRKAFLEAHPWCQATIKLHHLDEAEVIANNGWYTNLWGRQVRCPASCDIHHKSGRTGTNYLDESTWCAISRENHEWLHFHPSDARRLGLLA